MSDRNLRGKSSILNLLYAALRGEFPGRVKSDVWKWLDAVEVTFTIDGVLHRTELSKPAGEENPARSTARISRSEDGDGWVTLYEGEGGEGLKSEMDRLMMEELDFPIIYAHNKNTGGHQHGWPAISSSLFMSSSSEAKSLFGDIYLDALPLRLLQLFIGLPWVSTYSAALTASKQLEQGRVTSSGKTGVDAALTQRLENIETKLKAARSATSQPERRSGLRSQLDQLDDQIMAARKDLGDARSSLAQAETSMKMVSENFDEVRRRIKRLEDEQSAGYSFRKLSPSCCPACEASFKTTPVALEVVDANSCALCKNELPPASDDEDDERINAAKEEAEALETSLKVARALFKAAEKAAGERARTLKALLDSVAAVQSELSVRIPDPEVEVVQLEAQAAQLKDLISSLGQDDVEDAVSSEEVEILRAATDVSKILMTAKQADILTELTDSVMAMARKFGMSNVTSMHLDNGGKLKVHQGGADDYFSNLTMGERLRIKIAVSLAAVEVAKRRGHGRHPGLLVIDSPASEEVVDTDFEQMLDSVSSVVSEMADVQVIIGTTARPSVLGVVPRDHRLHATGDDYLF
ncbi:ATP-binding protein [Devosia sp.]|uniref:ATP-binding protein n=1 Tax=Devosia sp. TaxID=1871048 RepID=UPI003BA8F463